MKSLMNKMMWLLLAAITLTLGACSEEYTEKLGPPKNDLLLITMPSQDVEVVKGDSLIVGFLAKGGQMVRLIWGNWYQEFPLPADGKQIEWQAGYLVPDTSFSLFFLLYDDDLKTPELAYERKITVVEPDSTPPAKTGLLTANVKPTITRIDTARVGSSNRGPFHTGSFVNASLPVGDFRLFFEASGHVSKDTTVQIRENAPVSIDVTLAPVVTPPPKTGTLSVVVNPGAALVDTSRTFGRAHFRTGSFSNATLGIGTYRLDFTAVGYVDTFKVVTITDGGHVDVTMNMRQVPGQPLPKTGKLSGVMTPNDAQVDTSRGNGRAPFRIGNFSNAVLPVGTYMLHFTRSGYVDTLLANVVVQENQLTSVTMVMRQVPGQPTPTAWVDSTFHIYVKVGRLLDSTVVACPDGMVNKAKVEYTLPPSNQTGESALLMWYCRRTGLWYQVRFDDTQGVGSAFLWIGFVAALPVDENQKFYWVFSGTFGTVPNSLHCWGLGGTDQVSGTATAATTRVQTSRTMPTVLRMALAASK